MFNLIQLYNMIDDKKLFISLFSDLSFELEELGYIDDPDQLVSEMLENHFGITLECEDQLQKITKILLRKQDLNFLQHIAA